MQLNRLGHFDLCWLVHFRPMTIGARFTVGLALQTGCLVVPDLTPLLTKIRTLIHEEISLPWRTLFPLSSNDPVVVEVACRAALAGMRVRVGRTNWPLTMIGHGCIIHT